MGITEEEAEQDRRERQREADRVPARGWDVDAYYRRRGYTDDDAYDDHRDRTR